MGPWDWGFLRYGQAKYARECVDFLNVMCVNKFIRVLVARNEIFRQVCVTAMAKQIILALASV